MSGPSPNLALIRHAVLAIVETAVVSRCKVLIDQMIMADDQWAAVVEHMARKIALGVQSGWTCMQVIADMMAMAV